MKVSLYILFILAAFVLAAAGCTRNNGNIGAWFGTWRVVSIEVDGAEVMDYRGNVVVKFQNDIIETSEVGEHHEFESWWATWHSTGKHLVIDGRDKGIAPALMLPADTQLTLDIVHAPGDVMEWEYICADGKVMNYKLKKLY